MRQNASPAAFSEGQNVFDSNQGRDDGEAYIVGVTDQRADGYYIEAIDKTVAECNPDCPSDDRVVEIVFADELDSQKIDVMEKDASIKASKGRDFGAVFAENLRNHDNTTVYTYPESRLEVV